jgi:uncharacterized protein
MSLYYLDDFSLGEIAEEFHVSRQAVYDNIKRTEAMLEDYEGKLNLFEKFQKRQTFFEQITDILEGQLNLEEKKKLKNLLNELKELD